MMNKFIEDLSEDTQKKMNEVFSWFNSNVNRLETAYKDIGMKFDKVSQELNDKNNQLIQSFVQNEEIKTQLKSILTSMQSGVIMVNTSGEVTLCNSAAESLYGIKASEILGKNISDVFKVSEGERIYLIETLAREEGFKSQEKYYLDKGVNKPIGFTTTIVRDPKNKILGAVEISTDLTELKAMQSQVQHAKTLAAIGQMAATVAHEIRNPLGAIGGFAGLLERDLDPEDSRRPLVSKIVQGVSSLNKIVSNLLVFSRPMEIQLRKIEIIDWIDEILRYAELEAERLEKNLSIERNYQFERGVVLLDPEKFQQVLLNLTFNAIQAVEQKGALKLTVGSDANNCLFLCIRDNGKGIEESNQAKIFDPFFTTREQGTGLGLAIVKRIVELHGGVISVESKLNLWTEFTIKLNSKVELNHG